MKVLAIKDQAHQSIDVIDDENFLKAVYLIL